MARVIPYIFAVLTVLGITSRVLGLEMSSKRDCAVCHVMWLNDFRTDKETLIEWQPGNVLMKDTQGVVSSEDICYSCHDGYVSDSRYKVWKYNNHKTSVKPSDKVAAPFELPLSNKDELYCGTCHTAHGPGAIAEGGLPGPNSFMRVTNVDSSLCEMCHTNQADFKRTNGHPLETSTIKVPDTLFELGAKRAKERNQVICQSCHRVHGARGDKIVIVENTDSELCAACHAQQRSLLESKHDLRLTLPEVKNVKQELPSQSGPCGACHAPHRASGRKLWARAVKEGNPASQMCLTCHGEDSVFKIKGVGKYSHPISVEQAAKESTVSSLPLFLSDGTENSSGRVECFTCHNVHRWDPDSPANTGGKNVDGDASNSFLRIPNNSSSSLCVECHVDKKQVVTSDHNLAITAPEENNLQGRSPRDSGPCGACHLAHNAAGKKMWARRLSDGKDFVTQLCTGCHSKTGAAKEKLIGENYHPVDVALEKLNGGEAGKHAVAKLPLYGSDGGKSPDGNMVCITCHEPHSWDPRKSEPVSNTSFQNREGDATNSFLRKANFPSSNLCKVCHPAQARVDGTVHDLNVSAPGATNLLEQTVKVSGQCGACHLVHNSPNKLKLWARPYGPIPKNQNIMSALCTSCHSKENSAEKKVPPIASHPSGKLINNIMRFNKEAGGYTPIFDDSGKERNVGDISCPSCHNSHRWSTNFEGRSDRKDAEGNSTKTFRFLRNMSYDTVCSDCHGPKSIFRYLYFHDPEHRPRKLSNNG